jgi:hypothetical protein
MKAEPSPRDVPRPGQPIPDDDGVPIPGAYEDADYDELPARPRTRGEAARTFMSELEDEAPAPRVTSPRSPTRPQVGRPQQTRKSTASDVTDSDDDVSAPPITSGRSVPSCGVSTSESGSDATCTRVRKGPAIVRSSILIDTDDDTSGRARREESEAGGFHLHS